MKLGLIAGGGQMPVEMVRHLVNRSAAFHVIAIEGLADPVLDEVSSTRLGIGAFGEAIQNLKEHGCTHVCLAGYVQRPDYGALERDAAGEAFLKAAETAGQNGDDALLRQVAQMFQAMGFQIIGAHQAVPELLITAGTLTDLGPQDHGRDLHMATRVARGCGALEIGQAAVVAKGLVLAVEAQEGTDKMLARVASLAPHLRGTSEVPKGVLAKFPKPHQDLNLDMPVIGVKTLYGVKAAGLSGIVALSGGLLIVEQAEVITLANRLGLFIHALSSDELEDLESKDQA